MLDYHHIRQLVLRFSDVRLLCVGDLILDSFQAGNVERLSPERPVPVLKPKDLHHCPGGAANVAINMIALGAKVSLVGTVGSDEAGEILRALLIGQPHLSSYLTTLDQRPTTHKLRFTAAEQHLLRVDREETTDISTEILGNVLRVISRIIDEHDVLVISDYAKGLLTPGLTRQLLDLAEAHNKPCIVDPKTNNPERYAGATLITPNIHETQDLTQIAVTSDLTAERAGRQLLSMGNHSAVLITRGSEGMTLVEKDGSCEHLPCIKRPVFDIVGAGDTVIATLSCILAAGGSMLQAAACANLAAGIVVGKPNTAVAHVNELLDQLGQLGSIHRDSTSPPSLNKTDLLGFLAAMRANGKRIGFTNGVFDIVHPGHVSILTAARNACDILIVGINSDSSAKSLNKGPGRPVNTDLDREAIIRAFSAVDATIIFDEDTPLELIRMIRPDVLIKGADYALPAIVGAEFVASYGGQILIVPLVAGRSSSALINKVVDSKLSSEDAL